MLQVAEIDNVVSIYLRVFVSIFIVRRMLLILFLKAVRKTNNGREPRRTQRKEGISMILLLFSSFKWDKM